ncbi:MAG: biopolymer transporter ExbD [Pirellulales bacterium]|nr:biopolymer transporter ExbD [Pirellulales bacterium]
MSGTLSSENRAEPNLTPLLDMVFQLITFFMLVVNFKTAALDLNLRLPVVGSARPVESLAGDLLVLNIDKEGTLKVYNNPIKGMDIPAFIAGEAQASLLAARRNNPKIQPGDDLPTTVIVRADKETPFKLLNRVVSSCQKNGFRNFSLKALNRKQEP